MELYLAADCLQDYDIKAHHGLIEQTPPLLR